jgi:predicted nuclease with TOPRIM domain
VQPAGKSALIEKLSVNEKELNELTELLRELEETLARLKVAKDPERRRLLVRKMSRLFAEIELSPIAPN